MSGIGQGFTPLDQTGAPVGIQGNPFAILSSNVFGSNVPVGSVTPAAEEVVGVQTSASNTGAAAAAVSATLPGAAGKTTYIRGLVVSATNPAAPVSGVVTVANLIGGTMSFQFVESATAGGLLIISFGNSGLAANAQNIGIIVSLPAIASGGAGAVAAWGVQL